MWFCFSCVYKIIVVAVEKDDIIEPEIQSACASKKPGMHYSIKQDVIPNYGDQFVKNISKDRQR